MIWKVEVIIYYEVSSWYHISQMCVESTLWHTFHSLHPTHSTWISVQHETILYEKGFSCTHKQINDEYYMRSSLFLDVMQYRLVVSYWCFGTTNRYHLQGSVAWPLKKGGTVRPKTSVTTNQCCVTSQKGEYLIYTTAKAWNYGKIYWVFCSLYHTTNVLMYNMILLLQTFCIIIIIIIIIISSIISLAICYI
jgi:hypothetical protein